MNFSKHGQAIHLRHVPVQQDQVKGCALFGPFQQGLQAGANRVHRLGLPAQLAAGLCQHIAHQRVVVHNQNFQAGWGASISTNANENTLSKIWHCRFRV